MLCNQFNLIPKAQHLNPGIDHLRLSPLVCIIFCSFSVAMNLVGCQKTQDIAQPQSTISEVVEISSDEETLSEDQRAHLWEVEHLGFVLERTVFPPLKEGLKRSQMDSWMEFVIPDCLVREVQSSTTETHLAGELLLSQAVKNGPKTPVLDWLNQLRSNFDAAEAACSASLGLVRLVPVDRNRLDGEFVSVWRLRLAGSKEGNPVELETEFELSLKHLHDDVSQEKNWIESISVRYQRLLVGKSKLFDDWTDRSGLVAEQRQDNWNSSHFEANTGGVYVTDYNLDGHLDVLIDDTMDGIRLYAGNGDGTFVEVTSQAGLKRSESEPLWTLSCWADFDGDHDDDLITEDRLYENLGNGKFQDITGKTNLPITPAAGYAVGDFNCDGLIDLYVCHTAAYRAGQKEKTKVTWIDDGLGVDNVLFRNDGNWQFTDVTKETNTGGNGTACFAAVWVNVNGDRWPDLFAINEFGANTLFINQEGKNFSLSTVDPVYGGLSMGVAAGDFDNNGACDLYVANMYSKAGNRILANVDVEEYSQELFDKINEGTKGSKLYRSNGDGTFETVSPEDSVAYVGWAYGPTLFDLNNDGWLDIYATAGFKSVKRGEPDG